MYSSGANNEDDGDCDGDGDGDGDEFLRDHPFADICNVFLAVRYKNGCCTGTAL